jgi:hypothetical protein
MAGSDKNGSDFEGERWIRSRTLLKALELSLLVITAIGTVTLVALTLILVFQGG